MDTFQKITLELNYEQWPQEDGGGAKDCNAVLLPRLCLWLRRGLGRAALQATVGARKYHMQILQETTSKANE